MTDEKDEKSFITKHYEDWGHLYVIYVLHCIFTVFPMVFGLVMLANAFDVVTLAVTITIPVITIPMIKELAVDHDLALMYDHRHTNKKLLLWLDFKPTIKTKYLCGHDIDIDYSKISFHPFISKPVVKAVKDRKPTN